jgi:Tol biopolymer transport system component
MTDPRSLLERADRAVSGVPLYEDGLRRVLHRRDRRRRNQRIGALVTAGLIAVVFAALAVRWLPDGTTGTAGNPNPTSDPIGTILDSIAGPKNAVPPSVLIDLDGGDRQRLPRSFEGAFLFDVSPDGTQVAFSRDAAQETICCASPVNGYVAGLDGKDVRRITPDGIDALGLRWSPDGSMLVYQGLDASTTRLGDLFLIDVATGRVTQVTHLEQMWRKMMGRFLAPSFSADGTQILFNLPRRVGSWTAWDLWTVPVTGGEPTLLRRNAEGGAYSPDGGRLAYLSSPVRGDSSTVALQVVDVDGGKPRTLAEGLALVSPWWSPDGTMVAYVKDTTTYVVEVATGESRQVIRGAGYEDWVDNDTLIVGLADEIR